MIRGAVDLYESDFYALSCNADRSAFWCVRSAAEWPSSESVRAEFQALESALAQHNTSQAVLLIDSCAAPAGVSSDWVRASEAARQRVTGSFRRTAVLVDTSAGAQQTTELVVRGRQDSAVFRDEKAAWVFLGTAMPRERA